MVRLAHRNLIWAACVVPVLLLCVSGSRRHFFFLLATPPRASAVIPQTRREMDGYLFSRLQISLSAKRLKEGLSSQLSTRPFLDPLTTLSNDTSQA
jgi:hypothetical protein